MEVLKSDYIIHGNQTQFYQNKFIKIITGSIAFKLDDSATLITEHEWLKIWKVVAGDQPLDEHLPKALSEVLVLGDFVVPDQLPAQPYVRVQVASIDKTLYVFPQRYWYPAPKLNQFLPYAPEPVYHNVSLSWQGAYGGALNPDGMGAIKNKSQLYDESLRVPLPLIEHPDYLLTHPFPKQGEVLPAAFAPLNMLAPLRWRYVNAKTWAKAYPALPEDLDPLFFQQASLDQCQEEAFKPNAIFRLEGMGFNAISGHLPNLNLRVFLRTATGRFHELNVRADTLWFLPNHNIGVITYRSKFEVEGWSANAIDMLMLSLEDVNKSESIQYYYRSFADLTGVDRHLYQFAHAGLLPGIDAKSSLAAIEKTRALQRSPALIKSNTKPMLKSLSSSQRLMLQELSVLHDLDFSGYDLMGVDFSEKTLLRIDFSGADLSNTFFVNAKLQCVNFNHSNLCSAKLMQSKIEQCVFNKSEFNLTRFDFAHIASSQFVSVVFFEVNFAHACLRENVFIQSDWVKNKAVNVLIFSSQFIDGFWRYLDLPYAQLKDVYFNNVVFDHVHFSKMMADKLDVSGANTRFDDCCFSDCQVLAANFLQSNFKNTILKESNFAKSEWRAARWIGVSVMHTDLSEAKFTDAELEGVTFTQVLLPRSHWQGAYLKEVIFVDSPADLKMAQVD
jgi:uncharacterized protein YjbI with pentapeptide repeats